MCSEMNHVARAGPPFVATNATSNVRSAKMIPSTKLKKIVGVIQYDPWVIPRALDFLVRTKDRWPWPRILSHKYPLEQINEAFRASEWHNKDTTSITRAALTP